MNNYMYEIYNRDLQRFIEGRCISIMNKYNLI